MTRNYDNQRREYPRSDSRGSSSRGPEEKRPSRPARPRLNRDTVDRAWENGARPNHADYRTRSDSKTHSTRDSRQSNQQYNRYSAQNNSNDRKPYGNRQDNYRPGERSPRSNNGSRPRTYESSSGTRNDEQYNRYQHRGYSKQSYQDDYRPRYEGNAQHPHSHPPYKGRDQYRGVQRREADRETAPSRNSDRDQRPTRGYERNTRPPRRYDRDQRSSGNSSGPDTRKPHWQRGPERRNDTYSSRSHAYPHYEAEHELFEGDYEHFDQSNSTRSQIQESHQPEERHATRLPDDRSQKDLRGKQQRKSELVTEAAQESDELVKQVKASHAQEASTKQAADLPDTASTRRKTKPRTRKASESAQGRKATKAKVRQNTPKAPSTGPKPSQRGYKWPTP